MCKGSLKTESTSSSTASYSTISDGELKIPSGFDQNRRLIESIFTIMSVLYGSIYYYNPDIPTNPELCSQDVADGDCRRPDLIGYKVVALLSMTTMGLLGVYTWHFTPEFKRLGSKDATPEDRLFGYVKASDYLNSVIFCYQLWDIVISLAIPDHRDPIFLIHHVLALLTAYCSLEYQMVSYYSIFYGGCSEFSSIFLVFLDKNQVIPVPKGSFLDQWVQICQVLFFLSFSFYRVYGWIRYSFPLWKDCQAVIESGTIEKYRPGKAYFLRLFQGLDFALGALQCYWYYQIMQMIASIVAG